MERQRSQAKVASTCSQLSDEHWLQGDLGFRAWGSAFRVQGLGFRVLGFLGFRGSRLKDWSCRVQGIELPV